MSHPKNPKACAWMKTFTEMWLCFLHLKSGQAMLVSFSLHVEKLKLSWPPLCILCSECNWNVHSPASTKHKVQWLTIEGQSSKLLQMWGANRVYRGHSYQRMHTPTTHTTSDIATIPYKVVFLTRGIQVVKSNNAFTGFNNTRNKLLTMQTC